MSIFFFLWLAVNGWTNSCMVQLQWGYLLASLPKWNREGLLLATLNFPHRMSG